jgi:hypothetical protein
LGKQVEVEETTSDTLYFNTFTEDFLYWVNDLENDVKRVLRLNRDSHFFDGLQELEMENRIGPLLARYTVLNFLLVYDTWEITFFWETDPDDVPIPLRKILEKTATFHGFKNFSACINQENDDLDGILHARLVNVLSHGNYSLYEPQEMLPENKDYFRKVLRDFMNNYRFNPELFPAMAEAQQ